MAYDILTEPQSDETGEIKLNIEPEADAAPTPDAPALPEKLAGKSAEEIAAMYLNLESEHGRVANEFGTLRAQHDVLGDMLKNQTAQPAAVNPAPEPFEVDAANLLDDPNGTLESWYAQRAASDQQSYEDRIASLESRLTGVAVRTEHADFDTVINSPEFSNWVRANPLRQRIAAEAGRGDTSAATDLVREFKAEQAPANPEPVADPAKAALDRAAEASLETPGSVDVSDNKPIFRASELRRLKATDYEKYSDPDFQNEVLLAYHEGRVQ